MIVVRVELHSAITGRISEIARMHICNRADGTKTLGNYDVTVLRGRSAPAFTKPVAQRVGEVVGHRRLDLHVWHLVSKALAALKYGKEAA